MVIIEELEAVRNLDEILTVDGIDCIFIGPGDLSQSMGAQYLGRPFHSDVQKLVRESIGSIVAAGRSAGTLVTEDNLADYLELGVRFLRPQAITYLHDGLRLFHKRVEETLSS